MTWERLFLESPVMNGGSNAMRLCYRVVNFVCKFVFYKFLNSSCRAKQPRTRSYAAHMQSESADQTIFKSTFRRPFVLPGRRRVRLSPLVSSGGRSCPDKMQWPGRRSLNFLPVIRDKTAGGSEQVERLVVMKTHVTGQFHTLDEECADRVIIAAAAAIQDQVGFRCVDIGSD